ncbi:MAG: PQQ-binding-like beta-propeller repeat protein [candidate division WOR-3 bacterium]|nr:PQQ-binding-like beta-propeller repeat protein [candidate division WOR-3 bacterium]
MFVVILSFLIMQPQGEIIWSAQGTGGIYCAVPTYDYNNDRHPDVVAAAYYGAYPSPPIRLFLRSGIDGAIIWTRADCQGVWGTRGLKTIDDISGDSIPDIIMGTPGGVYPGRTVFAINGVTSAIIWSYSYYPNAGWVYSVSPFVDINNDNYPEVLAGVGGTSNDRRGITQCFNGHTGASIWTFRPNDAVMCVTLHIDLNNDTVPEVLVASGGNGLDNRIYCLNGRTGSQIWSYLTGNSVEFVALIGDVNNNGTPDVVCGGWAYTVYCVDGANGTLIWQNNLGSGRVIYELRKIRDINNDGINDVVVGSWSNLVSVLSGQNGTVLWSQTVGSDCWNIDTLADITADNIPEVIAGAVNGRNIKVMNGASGEVIWQYTFVDRVYDVTAAPDLNGDNIPDVLVGLQDQNSQPYQLYAFKGLPSGVYVKESSTNGLSNLISIEYKAHQVVVKLSIPIGKSFATKLHDVNGRVLESTPLIKSNGSAYYLNIRRNKKPSGIYFVRVEIENEKPQIAKILLF